MEGAAARQFQVLALEEEKQLLGFCGTCGEGMGQWVVLWAKVK
jgi:hypothetical protein